MSGSIERDSRAIKEFRDRLQEQTLRHKAEAIFGRYVRNGHNITEWVADQLDEAFVAGRIADEEFSEVLAASLLWGGIERTTQAKVIFVIEAPWLVETSDIHHALMRVAVLRRIGLLALPTVSAEEWTEGARQLARTQPVIAIADGHINGESWQAIWAKHRSGL